MFGGWTGGANAAGWVEGHAPRGLVHTACVMHQIYAKVNGNCVVEMAQRPLTCADSQRNAFGVTAVSSEPREN